LVFVDLAVFESEFSKDYDEEVDGCEYLALVGKVEDFLVGWIVRFDRWSFVGVD